MVIGLKISDMLQTQVEVKRERRHAGKFVFLGMNPALLLALFLHISVHPFYISMCQIELRPEAKTAEVAIKCFTDDLEKALVAETGVNPRLGTPAEAKDARQMLEAYFNRHFRLKVNDAAASLQWVGFEVEMDVVWVYFEAQNLPKPQRITVFNDVLVREFENQNNIVQVTLTGKTKGLMLGRGKTSGEVQF